MLGLQNVAIDRRLDRAELLRASHAPFRDEPRRCAEIVWATT